MRVTAGKYKNRQVKIPDTQDIRPTLSKIRESVFNMVQNEINDAVMLDLFAGSAIMGIEAASRGAKKVVFIEKNHRTSRMIKENLKNFDFEHAVFNKDALFAVEKLAEKFDIIFADPPYNIGILDPIIKKIKESEALKEDGILIIEHSSDEIFDTTGFEVFKEKTYGDTRITILRSGSEVKPKRL